MAGAISMADVYSRIEGLREYVEAHDFAGYDPYDALNSRVLKLLGSRSKWVRIAFTQGLKRLPVNARPLLRIPKGHHPKAIGLFLWGYARLYRLQKKPEYLGKIDYLLSLLEKLRSRGYSGNCWGHNFDWQSRTYFRPQGTPTIVNTSFIGHALLDYYELAGQQVALQMAIPIADFILNDLYRTREGDTFCFSYTPVDRSVVHNANMLGASLLVRLSRYINDQRLIDPAMASLAYSMRHQRDDGSWCYAETSSQKWIDSFHTGFNLQALRYVINAGYGNAYRFAYEKGVEFYARQFFLEDGTPKYYHDRICPIDIHCPAQAIAFFSGLHPQYQELTDRVLRWTLQNMWSDKGFLHFQKHLFYVNRIPYMRWSQAWFFHALTEYLLRCHGERQPDDSQMDTESCSWAQREAVPNSAEDVITAPRSDSVLRAIT